MSDTLTRKDFEAKCKRRLILDHTRTVLEGTMSLEVEDGAQG